MKANLEYNLPDDSDEFETAINAEKWKHTVWQLDNWLRAQTKHAPDTVSNDTYEALALCREQLYELLNTEGLKLWALTVT